MVYRNVFIPNRLCLLFSEQNSHVVTGTVTHSSPLQDIQLEAFTTKKGERGFFLL